MSEKENSNKKKEVIDYLRNKQKAFEIEAKVNGINIWVLMGAASIVFWKLLEEFDGKIFYNYEITLRLLFATQLIGVFIKLCMRSASVRKEVRYTSIWLPNFEFPLLALLQSVFDLLPPALVLIYSGPSLGVVFVTILEFTFMLVLIRSMTYRAFFDKKSGRFPRPEFEVSRKSQAFGNIIMFTCLAVVLAEQVFFLNKNRDLIAIQFARSLALVLALYWLIVVIIQRKYRAQSIGWTYELETDLMVDAVSPEYALKRIEYRALGTSLQDVMDKFFDHMERKFIELDDAINECQGILLTVESIPEEYLVERNSRINKAGEGPRNIINKISNDNREFSDYLSRIKKKRRSVGKPAMDSIIKSLDEKNLEFQNRIKDGKVRFENLMGNYS